MTRFPTLIVLLCLAASALVAAPPPALDHAELGRIPVQEGGRKKPYSTLARETLLTLAGRTTWKDPKTGEAVEAMPFLTRIWLEPAGWEKEPLLLVSFRPLKQTLGLDENTKRFSFEELAGKAELGQIVMRANAAKARDRDAKLDPSAQEALQVVARLELFRKLLGGAWVTPLPHPTEATGRWMPLESAGSSYPPDKSRPISVATGKLRAALAGSDGAAFTAASAELRSAIEGLGAPGYPARDLIEREDFYYDFHPFRLAWIFYLTGGLALLLTSVRGRVAGYRAAWALVLIGFAAQVFGFWCRVTIAGRPPVTNMYESVIWVAFGTILFALIFEAIYRCRIYLLGAVPLAVVSLILADTQPAILNSAITPLTPVLRDNFWLTTHVLSITLSYAAFLLALGVGHIALGKVIAGTKPSAALFQYLYRALQIGVLLLAVGTILGAVWANYSWGRFWDWDPKETWALIALLGYLIVLHGRIAGWWAGFGLAVGSVLGFLSVLMAWYGVNFVLGAGLHSYGFGTGGFPAVMIFVGLDVVFVAVALSRYRVAYGKRTREVPVPEPGTITNA